MLDNILNELNMENAWCVLLIVVLVVGIIRVCPALTSMFIESFTSQDETAGELSLEEQKDVALEELKTQDAEIKALFDEVDTMCESKKEALKTSSVMERMMAVRDLIALRLRVVRSKDDLATIEMTLDQHSETLETINQEKRGLDKKVEYQQKYTNKFGFKSVGAEIRADLSEQEKSKDAYKRWVNKKYPKSRFMSVRMYDMSLPTTVRSRIAKYDTDIKALNDKMVRARQKYNKENEKLDDLVEELNDMNDKVEQAEDTLERTQERISRARSSVQSSVAKFDEATAALADYDEVTSSPDVYEEEVTTSPDMYEEEVTPSPDMYEEEVTPSQGVMDGDIVVENFAEEQPINAMTSKSSAIFSPSRYAQWESLSDTNKQAVLVRKNQLLQEAFSLPQP